MHRAEAEAKGALLSRHVQLEQRLLEANRKLAARLEAAEQRAEEQSRAGKGKAAATPATPAPPAHDESHALRQQLQQLQTELSQKQAAAEKAQQAAQRAEQRAADAEAEVVLYQSEALSERDRRLASEAEAHLWQAQASHGTQHSSHAEEALRELRGRLSEVQEERDALAQRLADVSSRASSQKVSPAHRDSEGADRGALQRLMTTAHDLEEQLELLQRQRRQDVALLQSQNAELRTELDRAMQYNDELAVALEEALVESEQVRVGEERGGHRKGVCEDGDGKRRSRLAFFLPISSNRRTVLHAAPRKRYAPRTYVSGCQRHVALTISILQLQEFQNQLEAQQQKASERLAEATRVRRTGPLAAQARPRRNSYQSDP